MRDQFGGELVEISGNTDQFGGVLVESDVKKKESGDFVRGAGEAFQQVPQLGYGLIAGAGALAEKAVGEGGIATGIKKAGVEGYQRWGEKVAEGAKESDSWTTSYNRAKEGDFGSLVDWFQHGLGYAAGQGVQILATAGLGSLAAKGAGVGAMEMAKGMVAKEAARITATKEGAEMSADAVAKLATANVATKIGQNTAMATTALGMEGGEIYGDLVSEAEKEGRELSGAELGKAFVATTGAGLLEFAGDKIGLDLMLGKKVAGIGGAGGRMARAATGAATGFIGEGATEYSQTLTEEWGKGKDPLSEESLRNAVDAAALGALGGTAMGGVGGALSGKQPSKPAATPDDILTAKDVDTAIQNFVDSLDGADLLDDAATQSAPQRQFGLLSQGATGFGQVNELADLVAQERADVEARRNAISADQQASNALRLSSELETTDARVAGAEDARIRNDRMEALDNIYANPDERTPGMSFLAYLEANHPNNPTPTPEEKRIIANRDQAYQAFVTTEPAPPATEQKKPNTTRTAEAQIAQVEEYLTKGYAPISGGRMLANAKGKKLLLTATQREYVKSRPTQEAQNGAIISGSTGNAQPDSGTTGAVGDVVQPSAEPGGIIAAPAPGAAAMGDGVAAAEQVQPSGAAGIDARVPERAGGKSVGFTEAFASQLTSAKQVEDEFKRQTGVSIQKAKAMLSAIELRNGMRKAGNNNTTIEPHPFTDEQDRLIDQYDSFRKKSSYLFHTTKSDNLASIAERGLVTDATRRQEGVSGDGKISFSANEALAKVFGSEQDVMLRVKKGYVFDDLAPDLLAGDGAYVTGKNVPPEALEVRTPKGWKPISELEQPTEPLTAQPDAPSKAINTTIPELNDAPVFGTNSAGKITLRGIPAEQIKAVRDRLGAKGWIIGKDSAVFPSGAKLVELKQAFGVQEDKPLPKPKKPQRASGDLLQRIKQLGGIDASAAMDITGEKRAPGGWKFAFRKGGTSLDDLATMLADEGYQIDTGDVDGGVQQLRDMIRAHIGGERNFKAASIEAQAENEARSAVMNDLVQRAEKHGINWKNLTEEQLDDAVYLAEDELRMAEIARQEAISDAGMADAELLADKIDDGQDIPFGNEVRTDDAALAAFLGEQHGENDQRSGGDSLAASRERAQEDTERGAQAGGTAQGGEGFALEQQTEAELAQREAAQREAEQRQRDEEAQARKAQAEKDQADIDARIKARAANPENFQFGESSREAAAPVADLFNQPEQQSAESKQSSKSKKLEVLKAQAQGKITGDQGAALKELADAGEHAAVDDVLNPVEAIDTSAKSVEETQENRQIGDFGEKLAGAKKDLWQTYRKAMSEGLPADLKEITLSKHFPEPDYEGLIAAGTDIRAIAAIKAMRDEIPAKPKIGYKLKRWGEQLKTLRAFSNDILNGSITVDKVMSEMRKVHDLQGIADRIDLYAELGYPALKSAKGYDISGGWTRPDAPGEQWGLRGNDWRTSFFNTRQEAVEALRAKLATAPENEGGRSIKLDLYKLTTTGEIVIGKKVASNKYIDLKGGFKGAREARQYLAEHEKELLDLLEKKKEVRPERRSVNNPRVGKDYRLGEDATPEKFAAEFGFRGVQFGNYVEQARRAKDLNNAYDALLDMASTIGVPPRAVSLDGSLGLAFGARGSGGRNAAAAHFEPDMVVINLTKANGFGSLGHEWFHALDNYFSRMQGKVEGHITDVRSDRYAPGVGNKLELDTSVRPEVVAAFRELMTSIRNSDYYKRSKELDKRRSKDYWSTNTELGARAFESYLISKAEANGESNDYLANIVSEEAHKIGNEMFGEEPYPYPTKADAVEINKAFDNLFATLQTKETDKGVALFSKSAAPIANPHTVESATEAILSAHSGKIKGAIKAMFDAGKARSITAQQAAAIVGEDALFSGGKTIAFFNPSDAITYFVADNISKDLSQGELRRLVMHEIGVHAINIGKNTYEVAITKKGLLRTISKFTSKEDAEKFAEEKRNEGYAVELLPNEWEEIKQQFKRMYLSGNKKARAAFDLVLTLDTKKEYMLEEAIAYFLQFRALSRYEADGKWHVYGPEGEDLGAFNTEKEAAENANKYNKEFIDNTPLMRRFILWFRNALREIGKRLPVMQRMRFMEWASSLTESDIIFMAQDAMARWSPEQEMTAQSSGVLASREIQSAEAFARMYMEEFAAENELAFSIPDTKSRSIPNAIRDVIDDVKYLGEITQEDEHVQSGADRVYAFRTAYNEDFKVYEADDGRVWINVADLTKGTGGQMVYSAIADYAYNTKQKFIGDPYGLTMDSIIRRTVNMLTSAIKHGTTRHLEPAKQQEWGQPEDGVEPLEWRGSDIDKTESLIHTFLATMQNLAPQIKEYRYDFQSQQFTDGQGRPIDGEAISETLPRAARAGEKTARRAVFLQSLLSEAGKGVERRSQLLEQLLRWGDSASPQNLDKLFSKAQQSIPGAARPSAQSPRQGKITLQGGQAGKIVGNSGRQYSAEQLAAMQRTGSFVTNKTIKDTLGKINGDIWKRMAQGIADQFRPVRDLDAHAYTLLRLSKGATGAFEALMHHGKLSINDGATDADMSGGVLDTVFFPLGKETTDFLRWIAGNRAERLKAVGLERLFTDDDIVAFKSLADGTTDFDYTLSDGTITRDRTKIYADSLKKFNGFSKNVLDIAEQSGLIDRTSRALWEHEFYVPFYRVAEEVGKEGEARGMYIKSGVLRQEAFKKLKGGEEQLNDLLANTLMNWAHLIDASAKNRAAVATLEAAEKIGAARKAVPGDSKTVWVMGQVVKKIPKGQEYDVGGVTKISDGTATIQYHGKVEYKVEDPYLIEALSALEFAGIRGTMMDILSKPKHWLTIGVTASPFFKVRNLVRDSVQAIATADLNYNPAGNVAQGWILTNRKTPSQAYVSALAGGGLIRFGTMLEGNEAGRTRQLIKQGAKDEHILDDESKWRAFYDKRIAPAIAAYNELGNRGEEVNRMALYDQLVRKGMSHAEASLAARDLMDFSMQGSWNTIRFLSQLIPFFNARLQGMYKLGRAASEDKARFAVVLGATSLVSLALLAMYGDDDDWKKREDWDRDNYWWFKFGGIAYRIPKPFEIGAMATLTERIAELLFDDEMTGGRFKDVTTSLVANQLAMNPVPQTFKPMVDLYANKDSFTKRPIESMGMDRVDPSQRYTQGTSLVARGVSAAGNAVTGENFLSPMQIDFLVQSYFGWMGATSVSAADMLVRSMSDGPTRPARDMWKTATGGMVADLSSAQSRYVSMMYDQAAELEQAHATYNRLRKEGRSEDAAEYRADHLDELRKYKRTESVKKRVRALNERIRLIERSNKDANEKRALITQLRAKQDETARTLYR